MLQYGSIESKKGPNLVQRNGKIMEFFCFFRVNVILGCVGSINMGGK